MLLRHFWENQRWVWMLTIKNTPLHHASRNEHENVVDLLLQQKYVIESWIENWTRQDSSLLRCTHCQWNPSLWSSSQDLGYSTHGGSILRLEGRLENLRNFFSNLCRRWSADRGGTWLEVIALHLTATFGMGLITKTLLENQNVGVSDVDDYCQTVFHYATTKVI